MYVYALCIFNIAHNTCMCVCYAYLTCLTFDITSGYTRLLFASLRHWFFFFVTNNMVGNGIEPEQFIEIVNSTNNLVGYVSGTLPNADTHNNIVILDDHDNSECDSDILDIVPEAPPDILSDKDIVTHANHDDSDCDTDCDTPSIGPDAPPNIPSDNDNTLSSQEGTDDETETYEIIDEILNKDNVPATPAIPIVNYPSDVENVDDYANGWEWQLEDKDLSWGPFLSDLKLNIQSNANRPETFFEALFDTSMWTTLAQETNNYAQQSIANK